MVQRITILGATGSIGRSTAEVLKGHRERFDVVAVVGGRDAHALAATAKRLGAKFAALADPAGGAALRAALSGSGIGAGAGPTAIQEAVEHETDLVVAAICGTAGLAPTYRALKPGRRIALANKESLVCAGEAFMREARRIGAEILPLDSEHNALSQALGRGPVDEVDAMILTASGGPFRDWPLERIAAATPAEAAAHPVWSMGSKINVDSASLMNKGLELIEAHHLFGIPESRLDALIHPQSIIHGLVQWCDGSVTAGLYVPDMCVPIANCLGVGEGARLPLAGRRLDLAAIGRLSFEKPDLIRFPCFRLAREALRLGGAVPTVLNAANEIAVAAFMDGRIGFLDIPRIVEETCGKHESDWHGPPSTIEEALAIDQAARRTAGAQLPRLASLAR